MSFRRVMPAAELWTGEMIGVVLDGVPVLLVHVEGGVRAYEDRCAHQRVPLSEGRLAGGVITCRAHQWQFDACTGDGINPDDARLRRFAVRVSDGHILVDVGAEP